MENVSIANGVAHAGLSVAALGPFFEADEPVNGDNINGWPLFSERQTFGTISGFFDQQVCFNGQSQRTSTSDTLCSLQQTGQILSG